MKLKKKQTTSILLRISLVTFFIVLIYNSPPKIGAQSLKRIDRDRPSVYLKYDMVASRPSRCAGEGGKQVILQLHNNTNTSINVGANFAAGLESIIVEPIELPDGGFGKMLKNESEVELCYDQEALYIQNSYNKPKQARLPPRPSLACSCIYRSNGKKPDYPFNIGFWIKPGEFVRFAIPQKFISQKFKVFTEFSYPWEFGEGQRRLNEPRHRVYFYHSDLPTDLL